VINGNSRWWPNHSLATTWIHSFDTTLTNELMISGLRDYHRRGAGNHKTDYVGRLGLPNPFGATNTPVIEGFGLNNYPFAGDQPFVLISNFVNVQDNATKVVGKHELQFGFQYRFEDVPKSIVSTGGGFNVDTRATSLYDPTSTPQNPIAAPQTGFGTANLYLGSMNYAATFRRPWSFLRRQEYAPYFQDNWKVTSRLSLNLGLRWEYRSPLHDKQGLLSSFSPEHRAYVVGSTLEEYVRLQATLPVMLSALNNYGGKVITYKEAGLPKYLVNRNYKQFGPRIGLAYRAFDGNKTVVLRGGYRRSFYTQPITNWFDSQSNQQFTSVNFQNSVTNTALSPDGLPNYGLRSVQTLFAGVNTPSSIINTNDARLIARGFNATQIDPNLRDPFVDDWNFTIEKELGHHMVARFAYTGNHSGNLQQTTPLNDATPEFIWYVTTRTPLPIGEFAGVARRPFDKTTYATVNRFGSTGWSNWNGVQMEIERRFHEGLSFQAFWVIGNTMAATSNVSQLNQFLPGAVPQDFDARNRFLNYSRDTGTPKHQVRWNWVYELPIGKGKKFAGTSNRFLDTVIGGWQLASTGQIRSNYFNLASSTNDYPTGVPVEVYGEKYPIQDCTTGACFPGYLYWNGYIPANRINSVDAQGRPNGIMGVPSNYMPAVAPLIPWGSTALPANAPANTVVSQFWDTSNVWVPLSNGNVPRLTYNDNLNPYRNQRVVGPRQWFMDASLFKFAKLTEGLTLRFNVDFFNVLNNPNNPSDVGDNGILSTRNSGSPARVTQLTVRLQW
jgi:TonB-dependent receptor-like protein